MHAFAGELFPICRSITGDGVRETLEAVARRIPLEVHEVPSGTPVLDWTVPDEWNIERRLHRPGRAPCRRLSRVEPPRRELQRARATVMPLRSSSPTCTRTPEHPDWIPYRTSYYSRAWGFCLAQQQLDRPRRRRLRGRDRQHAGAGLTHLRRVLPAGASETTRCCSPPTSAIPRSRTTTSPASSR